MADTVAQANTAMVDEDFDLALMLYDEVIRRRLHNFVNFNTSHTPTLCALPATPSSLHACARCVVRTASNFLQYV